MTNFDSDGLLSIFDPAEVARRNAKHKEDKERIREETRRQVDEELLAKSNATYELSKGIKKDTSTVLENQSVHGAQLDDVMGVVTDMSRKQEELCSAFKESKEGRSYAKQRKAEEELAETRAVLFSTEKECANLKSKVEHYEQEEKVRNKPSDCALVDATNTKAADRTVAAEAKHYKQKGLAAQAKAKEQALHELPPATRKIRKARRAAVSESSSSSGMARSTRSQQARAEG